MDGSLTNKKLLHEPTVLTLPLPEIVAATGELDCHCCLPPEFLAGSPHNALVAKTMFCHMVPFVFSSRMILVVGTFVFDEDIFCCVFCAILSCWLNSIVQSTTCSDKRSFQRNMENTFFATNVTAFWVVRKEELCMCHCTKVERCWRQQDLRSLHGCHGWPGWHPQRGRLSFHRSV